MPGKKERSIDELFADDPERAEAAAFGRRTGCNAARVPGRGRARGHGCRGRRADRVRRQDAGRVDPGGVRAGEAGRAGRRAPAPKGPQYLKFPGKDAGLVVLGETPLVAETPEQPARRRHHADAKNSTSATTGRSRKQTKDPDAWKITIDGEVNNKLETHARRAEEEISSR